MTRLSPSTKDAVERASTPVSSLLVIRGIGVSKSPSTKSFIRLTHAFIGLPILSASASAITMETNMAIPITTRLIMIASRVEAR